MLSLTVLEFLNYKTKIQIFIYELFIRSICTFVSTANEVEIIQEINNLEKYRKISKKVDFFQKNPSR